MYMGLERGAIYSGEQLTNSGSFKIEMKIDSVDFDQEIMYGTFQIHNLTDKYELLSSFFESVMMGNKYEFAGDETDTVHWGMFPEWRNELKKQRERPIHNNKNKHDLASYKIKESDFIYLKIKELFLLPDPNLKSIPGASIDGYYYCCYYKKLDCFAGHYYFKNATNQVSQQILLERVFKKTSQEATFS
ncbi:Glucose-induced degradation protein 4 like protein [Nosema granulosis]|uniref:Glucose-induced degradation protein 4 like protein n=1 Tax=Nosema granulosis TaxID=83296 RepID=A0A9P6KZA9_9MICR|nr:Glucose-induced degradation protein 4 like protein [Nosema granulosis]